MPTIQIITADERMRERRGVKALLLGQVAVGKTWQLHTLNAARTLLLDAEAGDLSARDVPVDVIRLDDWPTARDVACRIGGPNKSFASRQCYSQEHYDAIGGALPNLDRYDTIFVDSFSELSRICLRYAEQQPEAFSERTGKKDIRGAYGLLARELLLWANRFQHAREKNVVFVGVLEHVVDDYGRAEWRLQCEGSKTARELPAIVDQIITYQFLDFGDKQPPMRGFVCTNPNPWGYPAKDRSGKLAQIEPPDLGKLLSRLSKLPISKLSTKEEK